MSGSIFGAATSADIFVAPVCELFLPGPIIPTLSLVLFPSGLLQIRGQMVGGGGDGMSSQTKPLIGGECWEEKPEKGTGEKTYLGISRHVLSAPELARRWFHKIASLVVGSNRRRGLFQTLWPAEETWSNSFCLVQIILGQGIFCLWEKEMSSSIFFELPVKLFFQFKSFFNKRIDSEVEFRAFPEVSKKIWTIAWPFLLQQIRSILHLFFCTIRKHSQRSSQLYFLTLASKFRKKKLSQTETKFCESLLAQKLVSLPTKWQQDVFIACSSNWGSVGAMWVPASAEHKGMLGWQTGRHDQHRGGCTNENDKRAISRISLHSRTLLQQRIDPSRWTTISSST